MDLLGEKMAPILSYLERKKPLDFAIFRHYLLPCSQNIKGFLKALNEFPLRLDHQPTYPHKKWRKKKTLLLPALLFFFFFCLFL